ncbi:MAG: hypothetical protein F9K48_05675 [Candidatus Brocadia sp.]|nr:MAG: hypothetical protein F9K48_05675 [Candidatus Brocadia sp.]
MDISKLNKGQKSYKGGIYIFSGRPDPTWQVEEVIAQRLEELWDLLEPLAGECPFAPPLGYRGCFLRCANDHEWLAYDGVVTLKTGGGCESRKDKDRKFEKLLLSSAPKGIFPISF